MWDPVSYRQYRHERGRPFDDLLARVGVRSPSYVVDLGCGPGDRTATLLARWPAATVVGVDNSTEMLTEATRHAVPERLSFEYGDVRDWRPDRPVDVLLLNAVLQWVPGHVELLPQLADTLAPDGWLAMQVPANFDAPSHTLLAMLRTTPRWRDRVGADASRLAAVEEPTTYLTALARWGLAVDAWETTYLHVLPGEDAVLAWTTGTALRPVLAALTTPEQAEFLAEYGALLRTAYPRQELGTVLPFRRIFVVAQRRSGPREVLREQP